MHQDALYVKELYRLQHSLILLYAYLHTVSEEDCMNPKTKTAAENASKNGKRKKQRSPAAKFVLTVIKLLVIFTIAISCAVIGIVGGAIYGYIRTTPPLTDEQLQIKKFTTFIYDKNGNEMAQLRAEENRVWVDDKDIPKNLKNAFVAIEDERFYEHPGIDPKRIVGVVVNLLKPGSKIQGASTITQQLIRNLTNERQITLKRKVQEQWSAIQLERRLEKWQILELYLNVLYMGRNVYGVEAAAKTYFNKHASELDLAECASLAGITNNPAYLDPLTTSGREHNISREQLILKEMLKQGYITQAEYDQAAKEELHFVEGNTAELNKTSSQSYFVDQVVNDVLKDLMAKGMSKQIALKTIYNNGYKIYTTEDPSVQSAVDAAFKDETLFPKAQIAKSDDAAARNVKKNEHPQASMVIIDPKTGQVRAMYGGFGEKKGNTLNRATQIQRQVGSSMKPIAIYGPAVDQGLITPATIIDDTPVHYNTNNKDELYPTNDDDKYRGLMSIRDAIANSVNVVAAKLYMQNPNLPYPYLKKVGINRDNERYVSLALGGLKDGLNPMQMAAAYVPFDNKGIYIEPQTYTKVLDKDGNVVLEKKLKNTIVYKETTSFIMTSLMQSVVQFGTAYPNGIIKNQKGEIIPTAGKTGTTNDQKDRWFVGYSPYYVGAVWYGYDTPVRLEGLYNQNPALKIWNVVMTNIHKNSPVVPFPEPSGIVRKTICIYSGKVPTDLCDQDPRKNAIRYNEVFVKGTEPKDNDKCDVHVQAKVDKDSKDAFGRNLLAGPYCPPESIIEKVFIQRKVEYKPERPGDPYPLDWQYELPAGEYCNLHGAPSSGGNSSTDTAGNTPGAEGNNNVNNAGNNTNIKPADPVNGKEKPAGNQVEQLPAEENKQP